jgi:hypothetical protein
MNEKYVIIIVEYYPNKMLKYVNNEGNEEIRRRDQCSCRHLNLF